MTAVSCICNLQEEIISSDMEDILKKLQKPNLELDSVLITACEVYELRSQGKTLYELMD